MQQADNGEALLPSQGGFRAFFAREGKAVLALSAATIVVELGAYGLARAAGGGAISAALGALAAACVWVVLACPLAAAGGKDGWGSVLRGGIIADSSAVLLIVLCLTAWDGEGRRVVAFLAAVKIYFVYAAVSLAAAAAVCCGKTRATRRVLALVSAVVLFTLLATPFWTVGLLECLSGPARDQAAAWAVLWNPFYSVTSAVAERTGFVWHYGSVMYRITRIGQDVIPPPVAWYSAVWRYGLLAGLFGAVALRRRLGR